MCTQFTKNCILADRLDRVAGFSSTSGIANKGFSGMRRVVARFNFSCILIGNRPQSLTGHTADRWQQ